jgi:diguanylate cyclase (GGDEF)-like protein
MKVALESRIALALALLAAAALVLVVGFALVASSTADRNATEVQAGFIHSGITEQIERVAREQESVTIWNDAVVKTREGDQLWMEENIGAWMQTYFGHDRAYVLDEQGRLVHASDAGKTVAPPMFAGDGKEIITLFRGLKAEAAKNAGLGDSAVAPGDLTQRSVQQIGGRPAVLSAKLIVPFSDRLTVAPGDEYVHVAVLFLDGVPLAKVAGQYRLDGLRFVPAAEVPARGEAAIVLDGSDGQRLGHLAWRPDRPGVTLLRTVTPAFLAAALIIAGMAVYLFRGLRNAAMQVKASENHSRFLSLHDTLTGLPNRALFDERLEQALAETRNGGLPTTVLYLDLDRFKSVNDTLGHRAGDELIREAANRLRWEVQELAATVARLGGDEFAIVLAAHDATLDIRALAERLIAALSKPFALDDDHVHVGASIGIACAPQHGTERDELVRKADIALYEAKKQGRGRSKIFAEDMDDILKQRRVVEADLRAALQGGDGLRLVYQPLYGPGGRLIVGAEALLRWSHPVHGALAPDFIVGIAEESGLIQPLGEWILREACAAVRRVPVPWIAVNVSALQLRDQAFARQVLAILAEEKVEPQRIQIEVTEGVLIDDPVTARAALQKLRAAGVRVALDDFGTGYSSMSYLRHYSIDKLKIDRSFTDGLGERDGYAIVAAIVDMAKALNLDVIAEGVETAEQRDVLDRLGCDGMQGYLLSRPLPEPAFAKLFEAARPAANLRPLARPA